MIDITLLGTAALAPLPGRALTAALLTVSGRSILFDCGEGTQSAARKAHVSLMKCDLIALTHYHGDHIFGLPGLMQTLDTLGRTDPLYLTGPKGLEKALAPILALVGWVNYPIELIECGPSLNLADLNTAWPREATLAPFRTEHRVASQGYAFTLSRAGRFMPEQAEALGVPKRLWGRLQSGEVVEVEGTEILPEQVLGKPRRGLKFAFTGDTRACPSLVEGARGADLLIAEATYGENEQAELACEHGHMTFSQAARMARQADVRELWLAHYSQMVYDPAQYLENATEHFENTVCGRDGMRCTLAFEK